MNTQELKPFIKWAGGKRQLLPTLNENFPEELKSSKVNKYIEPFVGGGAVLFNMLNHYSFDEIIINDFNEDLINLYTDIKNNVQSLIEKLKIVSDEYLILDDEDKSIYFYKIRNLYNNTQTGSIEKSVFFLFLNKTCFNGLFRVNAKGGFNVPHGKYKNPMILDENNLLKVSAALTNVKIMHGDFKRVKDFVDNRTFIYLDPPYRPLNITSSFTSYVKYDFNDNEQIRLSDFYNELDSRQAKLMLSNSDPKNININDNFFDDLYSKYNIIRVEAKRSINSKANGRGKINELLIKNY